MMTSISIAGVPMMTAMNKAYITTIVHTLSHGSLHHLHTGDSSSHSSEDLSDHDNKSSEETTEAVLEHELQADAKTWLFQIGNNYGPYEYM